MGLVGDEQVELGVLLDLDAQLVEALDGGVAGEEVLRARPEGDDLEVAHADDGTGDGNEIGDYGRDIIRGAHRVLRDVGGQVAHAQVVAAVEHAAVGISAAVDEVAVTLGSRHEHAGSAELLRDEGLGRLGSEVAEEDHERVHALHQHIFDGVEHVLLVLDGDGALVDLALVRSDDGGSPTLRQLDGEAVAADRDDAELDLRDVVHGGPPQGYAMRGNTFFRAG